MKKYLIRAALPVFVLCALAFARAAADTVIMQVSDMHILAPELYQGSALLTDTLARADGKEIDHSKELADAIVAEALHIRPDALVLTGDLTFNGEEDSHIYLASKMREVLAAGVPVYVLPCNHDINSPNARDWSGEKSIQTADVDPKRFEAIWGDMLGSERAPEGCGFSYVIRLSDEAWILMLDGSVYEDAFESFGLFTKEQYAWVNAILDEAREKGVQVITATHHNMLIHTGYRTSLYTLWDGDALKNTLADHGMKINLSGHMHIQHIVQEDGVADCAIGAFCLSPHMIATVTVSGNRARYEARPVCDAHMPEGYAKASKEFFYERMLSQTSKQAAELGLTSEPAEAMAALSAEMRQYYFAGAITPELVSKWKKSPAWNLWTELGGKTRYPGFFSEMIACAERSMRVAEP